MSEPGHVSVFDLRQRFAGTVTRYEIQAWGTHETLALAETKALKLKEEVTFYRDERKDERLFSFQARNVIDLNAGYDVFDRDRRTIASFRKDFGASLARSTWHLDGPDYAGTGQERSQAVAVLRRIGVPFLAMHFDFRTAEGRPLMSVERESTVRDRYTVRVPDTRVDFRVAASLAVALDALMAR